MRGRPEAAVASEGKSPAAAAKNITALTPSRMLAQLQLPKLLGKQEGSIVDLEDGEVSPMSRRGSPRSRKVSPKSGMASPKSCRSRGKVVHVQFGDEANPAEAVLVRPMLTTASAAGSMVGSKYSCSTQDGNPEDLDASRGTEGPRGAGRGREKLRKLSRRVTQTISRALGRTHTVTSSSSSAKISARGTDDDIKALSVPRPPKDAPLVEHTLPAVTIAEVVAAVQGEGRSIFRAFMEETLSCRDVHITPWRDIEPAPGVEARRSVMSYVMPAPADMPDVARRIITIPEAIVGSCITWFSLSPSGDELVIMQRTWTFGVLYSDRFYVEYVYAFQRQPEGGLLLKQWADIVWRKALPWTHAFLGRILEKKVKAEAAAYSRDFLRLLTEMCQGQN